MLCEITALLVNLFASDEMHNLYIFYTLITKWIHRVYSATISKAKGMEIPSLPISVGLTTVWNYSIDSTAKTRLEQH